MAYFPKQTRKFVRRRNLIDDVKVEDINPIYDELEAVLTHLLGPDGTLALKTALTQTQSTLDGRITSVSGSLSQLNANLTTPDYDSFNVSNFAGTELLATMTGGAVSVFRVTTDTTDAFTVKCTVEGSVTSQTTVQVLDLTGGGPFDTQAIPLILSEGGFISIEAVDEGTLPTAVSFMAPVNLAAIFESYALASTNGGLISAADQEKLNNIEPEANKYVLPATLPATIIQQTASYRFVTDAKILQWDNNTGIGLGETNITAYRGDRGKTAYDHSQAGGNAHGATTNDIPEATDKLYITSTERTAWNGATGTVATSRGGTGFSTAYSAGQLLIGKTNGTLNRATLSGLGIGVTNGDGTISISHGAHSGDVTSQAGEPLVTTIANDAVTNAKLANMAAQRIKGNKESSTGDPQDLTVAEVKALLGYITSTLTQALDVASNPIYFTHVSDVISTGNLTINWGIGNHHKVTMNANVTLPVFTPPIVGAHKAAPLTLQCTYTGNYGFGSWPSNVRWPGGVAPTQTKVNGKTDIFTFLWNGEYYIGSYSLNYTLS
jgi:hypothetical protein